MRGSGLGEASCIRAYRGVNARRQRPHRAGQHGLIINIASRRRRNQMISSRSSARSPSWIVTVTSGRRHFYTRAAAQNRRDGPCGSIEFVQVGLVRRIVEFMLMRRETRPVASRCIHLVHHQLVRRELGTNDPDDLTGGVSAAAYLTAQVRRSEQVGFPFQPGADATLRELGKSLGMQFERGARGRYTQYG